MNVIHGLGIARALVSIVPGVAGFTVAAGILLAMTVGVSWSRRPSPASRRTPAAAEAAPVACLVKPPKAALKAMA
ncbi:MAG: hypothetical protein EOO25_18020 [Comamonadaceae bacterium]|nr:MAG: hypothetical protein EOO25_18020 [Comamonadaceae bacterium]